MLGWILTAIVIVFIVLLVLWTVAQNVMGGFPHDDDIPEDHHSRR